MFWCCSLLFFLDNKYTRWLHSFSHPSSNQQSIWLNHVSGQETKKTSQKPQKLHSFPNTNYLKKWQMTSLMSCNWVASICYTQSIGEAFTKSTQWTFPESGRKKKRLCTWLKIDPTSSPFFWRGQWDLKMTWAQPNCTEVFVCMCIHTHTNIYIFWLHICTHTYIYIYIYVWIP